MWTKSAKIVETTIVNKACRVSLFWLLFGQDPGIPCHLGQPNSMVQKRPESVSPCPVLSIEVEMESCASPVSARQAQKDAIWWEGEPLPVTSTCIPRIRQGVSGCGIVSGSHADLSMGKGRRRKGREGSHPCRHALSPTANEVPFVPGSPETPGIPDWLRKREIVSGCTSCPRSSSSNVENPVANVRFAATAKGVPAPRTLSPHFFVGLDNMKQLPPFPPFLGTSWASQNFTSDSQNNA